MVEPWISRRGISPPRKPNQIDAHVGRRLRSQRVVLGLSQEELGRRLGLTFQQVQKYELGYNRISASRLYQLSEELGVPVSWFFEGAGSPAKADIAGSETLPSQEAENGRPAQRELLELVRIYWQIEAPSLRRQLHEIARILASNGEDRAGCGRRAPTNDSRLSNEAEVT